MTYKEARAAYCAANPPEEFFLEDCHYALDEQRRIAMRFARWEHAQKAVAYWEKEGREELAACYRWEMQHLAPYWNKPGVTKEQAVAAFREARSSAGL
jgi:hypothetical protein